MTWQHQRAGNRTPHPIPLSFVCCPVLVLPPHRPPVCLVVCCNPPHPAPYPPCVSMRLKHSNHKLGATSNNTHRFVHPPVFACWVVFEAWAACVCDCARLIHTPAKTGAWACVCRSCPGPEPLHPGCCAGVGLWHARWMVGGGSPPNVFTWCMNVVHGVSMWFGDPMMLYFGVVVCRL